MCQRVQFMLKHNAVGFPHHQTHIKQLVGTLAWARPLLTQAVMLGASLVYTCTMSYQSGRSKLVGALHGMSADA